MQIGLMVPAQFGLNWERWLHIVELAERLDFHSVFRSDHYFSGAQEDSLEAYVSLAVAAQVTERIRFGPMVSPVTFRHPVDVGRMAAQIDLLSGGRFVMGVGAGWPAPEYEAYGLPSPPLGERFDRLAEAIEVMQSLWRPGTHSFSGRYYQLRDVNCLPKPAAGRPDLLIGGAGERRTLRLVAEHANEWNAVNLGPEFGGPESKRQGTRVQRGPFDGSGPCGRPTPVEGVEGLEDLNRRQGEAGVGEHEWKRGPAR